MYTSQVVKYASKKWPLDESWGGGGGMTNNLYISQLAQAFNGCPSSLFLQYSKLNVYS